MIYNRFFICFFIVCAVSSCNQQREHEGTAASTIEIPVELKGPAQPTGLFVVVIILRIFTGRVLSCLMIAGKCY